LRSGFGGVEADCQQALPLLKGTLTKAVLADCGCDTNFIRKTLSEKKSEAASPSCFIRHKHISHAGEFYKSSIAWNTVSAGLIICAKIALRFDRNN